MKPAFCLLLLAMSCAPVSVEQRENIKRKWEQEILAHPDFEWETVRHKDFRLYVKKGSWYGEHNEIMLEKVDSAWEYVQQELQETYTDTVPALFFFSHPFHQAKKKCIFLPHQNGSADGF